jgi:hypothetical protein
MAAGSRLLDSQGRQIIYGPDGLRFLSDGRGNECCCGTVRCPGGTCTHCGDYVPTSFEATISGLSMCSECIDRGNGTSAKYISGDPSITLCLPDLSACAWEWGYVTSNGLISPISVVIHAWTNATCSGSPDGIVFGHSYPTIELTRTSTGFRLRYWLLYGPVQRAYLFDKTITADGCRGTYNFPSNEYTECGADPGIFAGVRVFATGGSASIHDCCEEPI